MEQSTSDLEKLRQQYDTLPYPQDPLDQSPTADPNDLFIHNLVTPYYLRNQQVATTTNKAILDVGCGTGYETLVLAAANPGATVVGVDLSEKSIELAQRRLEYQPYTNIEFYARSITDLARLNRRFDYIHCSEVLYLLPDPLQGLQIMQSLLNPGGIIRTNLHSALQRVYYYRAQAAFTLLGWMDRSPQVQEISLVRELMQGLAPQVSLKATTWGSSTANYEDGEIVLNYLLQGDKGFTVPEMFALLAGANLELISMVQWREWNIIDLFKSPDQIPPLLGDRLPTMPVAEKLHLYELINPIHRLLDFWCGHPGEARAWRAVIDWQEADWERAQVHLHPQLQREAVKADLLQCVAGQRAFVLNHHLSVGQPGPLILESSLASCLLPLWNGPQSFRSLVKRWLQIHPLNPESLEPTSELEARTQLQHLLQTLADWLYVLLEQPTAE